MVLGFGCSVCDSCSSGGLLVLGVGLGYYGCVWVWGSMGCGLRFVFGFDYLRVGFCTSVVPWGGFGLGDSGSVIAGVVYLLAWVICLLVVFCCR